MADSDTGQISWYSPNIRAIFLLDRLKMPRSMRTYLKKTNFEYYIDRSFSEVIENCAKRPETWISREIIDSYNDLHRLGIAHSVETWLNGSLVGGLYGIALGSAFFGESMFSNVTNSSKAAFYHLVKILKENGFILLDSQFISTHTYNLGAIEIPRKLYIELLNSALRIENQFP